MKNTSDLAKKTSNRRSANYFVKALVALGLATAGSLGTVGIAYADPIRSDQSGVSATGSAADNDNTSKPSVRGPISAAPHLSTSAAAKAGKQQIPHHPAWGFPLAPQR